MARRDIVLVPFPFTDLTGQKRRPALVVSPDSLDREDLILCAITSQLAPGQTTLDVQLNASDLVEGDLPRSSVIKVGKLFTMHRRLIIGRFGRVTNSKLSEVLAELRRLFRQ
jgi:mRNA interferase MazF